jgi:hypothetical protein
VAESSPPALIARKSRGKSRAGTIIAGWRNVRRIERRATVPI